MKEDYVGIMPSDYYYTQLMSIACLLYTLTLPTIYSV